MLLSFSELWVDLTLKDWVEIIINVKRINPRPLGTNEGCFSDIEFLCSYLKIDAFQILNLCDIHFETKKSIIYYFRLHSFILDVKNSKKKNIFNHVEEDIIFTLKNYANSFLDKNTSITFFENENSAEIENKIEFYWKTVN
jgi:hypothetical protein